MSEHRVSKPILNHNIDNMSLTSAFHWVSHLLTDGYDLISKYKINSDFKEKSCLFMLIYRNFLQLIQRNASVQNYVKKH